jgi:hypothetical protein
LIIEHTAITGTGKLYSCFLLESSPYSISNETNDLDKLIKSYNNKTNKTSVTLNKTIPSQEFCVVYTSSGNTVVVFTNSIYLNNDSYKFITANIKKSNFNIFSKYDSSYIVLKKSNISQR